MSYSVCVMKKIAAELAKLLEGSDIEIIETHHRRKIDSPSGTALMLAESVNEAREHKMNYEFDRHSKREKRQNNEKQKLSFESADHIGYSSNESCSRIMQQR